MCDSSAALNRNVRVVPVLVGQAQLPTSDDLPPDLHSLLLRQTVVIHDETWHEDLRGLLASLRGERALVVTRRRRMVAGIAAAGLLLVAVTTWAVFRHENPPAVVLPSCPVPQASSWRQLTLDRRPTADNTLVHTGQIGGFRSVFVVSADRTTAVAAVCNHGNIDIGTLGEALKDAWM